MNEHVILAMSGAPDYEQKELQSNEKHVSAVLRMAQTELLLYIATEMRYIMSTEKNKKQKTNQEIIDAYDYLSNAASMQDCTGLIPSQPASAAELESYEDLYHFLPPNGKAANIKPGAQSEK